MEIFTERDELQAGTGFMLSLGEAVEIFVRRGYRASFIPCEDHFENSSRTKIFPDDICIDHVMRIENTSDPADTCILYAISVLRLSEKGLYIEPYGVYHDDLSPELRHKLCETSSEKKEPM